jgi:tetratricopeptide (TPR) repeat protein
MKRFLLGLLIFAVQSAGAQDIYNKAKAQLAAHDSAGAYATFQEAIKAGQKPAESNFLAGALAMAKGKVDEALPFLLASYKSDDENVRLCELLGDAYLAKKDIQSTIKYYKAGIKLDQNDCQISRALGIAFAQADSLEAATLQLTKASLCMPNDPLIYLSLGDAFAQRKIMKMAILNYQKASELAPRDRDIQLKVARSLTANREYTEAVKAYGVAEQIDSTYADTYFEHARILVAAKMYKLALAPARKFVLLKSKDVDGLVLLAKSEFGTDGFADAAVQAKAALQIDSSNVDIWRIRAHSLVETRDFKGAIEAFNALQRRNAIKDEDQVMLGRAYFGAGMDADAFATFERALTLDSTNCDVYFPFGSLVMKRGDYVRASQIFEKKIACDPRSLSAYINAGITYMQPSNLKLDSARARFVKSIDLKGDFLQGRIWLARYYMQVDSFDLAEGQYLEVVRLIGDNIDKNKTPYGEAYRLLGSLYMTKKQFGRAIEAFRKTQSVNMDDDNVHLSWGQAILQTLDPKEGEEAGRAKNAEAMKHFRICVEKNPGNVQGHFWLGETLVRARIPGDDEVNKKLKEEACSEWRKVLKLDPKNEDAKKGLERISC